MSDQNPSGDPFGRPPSGPTVPLTPITPRSNPWKPAAAGFGAAVLLGAGVFGITRLGSDDAAAASTTDERVAPVAPISPAATATPTPVTTPEPTGEPSDDEAPTDDAPTNDVPTNAVPPIDLGTAIGPIAECLGLDLESLGLDQMLADLSAQLGELPPVSIPEFGEFGPGDWSAWPGDEVTVTVTGPDGIEVYTLGDDGTVTVTNADGTVSVAVAGDAAQADWPDLGEFSEWFDDFEVPGMGDGSLPPISIPEFGEFGELGDLGALGELTIDELGECFAEPAG